MSQDDDLPLIWWSASRLSPYSPLGPTEIRLVEILPGHFDDPIDIAIRPVDLSTSPAYDALSYAWDPDDGTIGKYSPLVLATVRNCDDFSIQLGPNVGLAIRYLRKEDSSRTMWIDALPINQMDVLERNHQVGLMKSVYSSADHVRIWLGPPRDACSLDLTTISTQSHTMGERIKVMNVLLWLLRRSWFNRLWVAQELALSRKDPIVHCGHEVIDWSSFRLFVQNIRDVFFIFKQEQNLSTHAKVLAGRRRTLKFAHHTDSFERLAMVRNSSLKASFTEILLWSSTLTASDPRDKVFGILGICNCDQDFSVKPDYTKSVNQVYAEAAAQIIRERLDMYVTYQLWRYAGPFNVPSVRSWAPNLEEMKSGTAYTNNFEGAKLLDWISKRPVQKLPSHTLAVEFLDSFSSLFTAGRSMGRVVAANHLAHIMDARIPREVLHVLPAIKHLAGEFDAQKFCEELFCLPESSSLSRETIIEFTTILFQETTSTTLTELREFPEYYSLLEVMEQHLGMFVQVFVTEKGFLGLGGYLQDDIRQCVLTGLFGADTPFLLRERKPEDGVGGETTYTIVDSAKVLGHENRNEHFENLPPGTDWKDLVRSGKVEGFKIV